MNLIQGDIGGHPPFLTGSKQFYGNFDHLLFLVVFNFRGHFEGLNEGFSGSSSSIDQNLDQGSNFSSKINILGIASKRTRA